MTPLPELLQLPHLDRAQPCKRAPRILRLGLGVEPIARLEDGTVVAAREGKLLVSTFHPELTEDHRFHRYFLRHLVESAEEQVAAT